MSNDASVRIEKITLHEDQLDNRTMRRLFSYGQMGHAGPYSEEQATRWGYAVMSVLLLVGVLAGFAVGESDIEGGRAAHAVCASLGLIVAIHACNELSIRWRRRKTIRGEISKELVRKTNGEVFAYRLYLQIEAFNELVERFDQYQQAVALGIREPLANSATIIAKLQATRARLLKAIKLIKLMRWCQASEEQHRVELDALIAALGLETEGTGIRVAIDPAEANPDADEALQEGFREAEAALRTK